MNTQVPEGEPRYSLKSLQALFDGSQSGRHSARGPLRLHIHEPTDYGIRTYGATVIRVDTRALVVRTDDGAVRSDIEPAWVLDAEVAGP